MCVLIKVQYRQSSSRSSYTSNDALPLHTTDEVKRSVFRRQGGALPESTAKTNLQSPLNIYISGQLSTGN